MNRESIQRVLSLFLVLCLTITLSGCYVSRGFAPPGAQSYPGQFETLPATANLKLKLSHSWEGGPLEEGWALDKRISDTKKLSQEVFQSSKFFQKVEYGLANPDFEIELNVEELEKGSPSAATLSGITLTLIPVKTGAFFSVKATAKDRDGRVIGEYSSKGDFNATIQLLFLIVPFGWRFGIPNDVYRSIFKDILVQMNQDRSKFEESSGR